jgi:hypothetical protein
MDAVMANIGPNLNNIKRVSPNKEDVISSRMEFTADRTAQKDYILYEKGIYKKVGDFTYILLEPQNYRSMFYNMDLSQDLDIMYTEDLDSIEENPFIESEEDDLLSVIPQSYTLGNQIISKEDVDYFKTYLKKSDNVLPKEFFTSKTKFKEFFNPQTNKRESAPQSSKWLLNNNGLYDLVDKEGGEIYISNVNLKTGVKMNQTQSFVNEVKPVIEISAWNEISEKNRNNLAKLGYTEESFNDQTIEEQNKTLRCHG